jgi:hypothetical protein
LSNDSSVIQYSHYDNALETYGPPLGPGYVAADFPGCTVVYLRVPWSVLEPSENQFRWSALDTVIQRYVAVGKSFALCFTCFEGTPHQGTPNWIRLAGAKGYEVFADGRMAWEPDYEDPSPLETPGLTAPYFRSATAADGARPSARSA